MSSSVLDFLKCLEEEVIFATIRIKTYPIKSHRVFFKTLIEKKKEKIKSICDRNKITSIFDDEDKFNAIWNSIVGQGLPKFEYNNKYDLPIAMQKDEIVNHSVCINNSEDYYIVYNIKGDIGNIRLYTDPEEKRTLSSLDKFAKVRDNIVIDKLFYFYPGGKFTLQGYDEPVTLVEFYPYDDQASISGSFKGAKRVDIDDLRRIL